MDCETFDSWSRYCIQQSEPFEIAYAGVQIYGEDAEAWRERGWRKLRDEVLARRYGLAPMKQESRVTRV